MKVGLFSKAGIERRFNVTDLFLPPACLTCQTPISISGHLCPECWCQIQFISPPYCDRLGIPYPYDPGYEFISPLALQNPPVFTRARGVFLYQSLGREIIHRYKYGRQLYLAQLLAKMMSSAGAGLLRETDLIIPVPLHWTRLLKRGFNQSARLALEISNINTIPISLEALKRKQRTKTQVGLSASDREKNVAKAFYINEKHIEKIAGKNLLLIDDVLTSGATANACSKILLKSGASNVNLLVCGIVVET